MTRKQGNPTDTQQLICDYCSCALMIEVVERSRLPVSPDGNCLYSPTNEPGKDFVSKVVLFCPGCGRQYDCRRTDEFLKEDGCSMFVERLSRGKVMNGGRIPRCHVGAAIERVARVPNGSKLICDSCQHPLELEAEKITQYFVSADGLTLRIPISGIGAGNRYHTLVCPSCGRKAPCLWVDGRLQKGALVSKKAVGSKEDVDGR